MSLKIDLQNGEFLHHVETQCNLKNSVVIFAVGLSEDKRVSTFSGNGIDPKHLKEILQQFVNTL